MTMVRRILMSFSILLIAGSLFFLLGMQVWAYRLDEDFSASYACCTQEAGAAFHARFWALFFAAAKFGLAGCLGLAATLASRTALKVGIWTLGAAVALLICNFLVMNLEGWAGSTGFTITQVVFCAGVALLIIGGVRVGWQRFNSAIR
jgi:hypothetical protein